MNATALPPSTTEDHASMLVLIADDIESSRQETAGMLTALGHRCVQAASGQQTLQLVETHRPDIVLLDLLMPDMDGFEVTERLRDMVRDRWLPVIVTSSLLGEEHFIHALSRGADDYLGRPVNPALLQAKLQHYQRVLNLQSRVERMKDEFLATVSHELRTPLTSIVGVLRLLSAGAVGPLGPEAQELADMAQRNGERLSHLIDDVLDLTKLEGNRMVLQLRSSLLNVLLQESVQANQGYADAYGVSLALDCTPAAANALVDERRLLQVMANLVSNAVKHSHKGSTVRIALRGVAEGWCIDVIDQGVGIDPAFLSRLFEKFAQADSSDRRSVGGTGLGLHISRMLIERMGGRIEVASTPGRGSTFSVLLPSHEPGRRWALCVARDRQQLDRLSAWLSPFGRFETVMDIAGAKQLLAHLGAPSAVVADPQGQGDADRFCQELRALAPRQAIALTGDSIDQPFARGQGLDWIDPASRDHKRLLGEFIRSRMAGETRKL